MLPFCRTLARGGFVEADKRSAVAVAISRWSGMSEKVITEHNLVVPPSYFWKELLREEGMTIGRLDSRCPLWSMSALPCECVQSLLTSVHHISELYSRTESGDLSVGTGTRGLIGRRLVTGLTTTQSSLPGTMSLLQPSMTTSVASLDTRLTSSTSSEI